MPNAFARSAISRPISPRPMIPIVLSLSDVSTANLPKLPPGLWLRSYGLKGCPAAANRSALDMPSSSLRRRAGVLQVGFDDLERFDHKDVALREIVAHLLLGFCKDDVRGIQMPRIAAQCSKPAVEIGLVMRHEVRKSLHPIMRTMWIKDYRKEASESVILDEYIMIFHHSWPNSTGRSRAKREGPYLLTMCKSIFAACSRR